MTYANLVELADASVSKFADRRLFGEIRGDAIEWMTYRDWYDRVAALRGGLASLGVAPGDRVAIVSRNSAEWAMAAYASYGLGAAFVPMYEAQRPSDWELILRDCEATVVFGRTPELVAALREMQPRLPALRHIVQIEGTTAGPTLASLVEYGRVHPVSTHAAQPDDVAGLIYTSGTTGVPKGVMLTHHNLTSNIEATLSSFPFKHTDWTLSFLPWAHVYGQTCELHLLIAAGASTVFNHNTEHLVEELRIAKPTILVAVPRIFNKLYASVSGQIDKKPRPIRYVFQRGLAASVRLRAGQSIGVVDRLIYWLASVLFAAIRRKLGGNLRYAITGSATLSRKVAEFIDGLGIDVYEGYGLTETSPIVAFNRPGKRKFGTVGLPIADVSVTLDETRGNGDGEGEIIVRGPNVMKGYHARPDENARAFTVDHGLRTGDLGRFDGDGFLAITGRLKEQYKLENGKYVMPGPIEEKLAQSPFIRGVMLHGADRPYNIAVVAIDPERVRSWAAEEHIELGADLTSDERVRALIQSELDRNGADIRSYERPRDCVLTETAFTVENGFLTPTLKIKRREVLAQFGTAIAALYDHPSKSADQQHARDVGVLVGQERPQLQPAPRK
jgi:long-chain acyl-CoA synthetase